MIVIRDMYGMVIHVNNLKSMNVLLQEIGQISFNDVLRKIQLEDSMSMVTSYVELQYLLNHVKNVILLEIVIHEKYVRVTAVW